MTIPDGKGPWRLDWKHGSLTVLPVGAILWNCHFRLPDGSDFAPFAAASWAGDRAYEKLPGHMQWLGGEFVCAPFGVGGAVEGLPETEWRDLLGGSTNSPPHGFSANGHWSVLAGDESRLMLAQDYPASSPVSRVMRSIEADPDAPALDLTFTVESRRACRIPLGLHPILDLDRPAGQLRLAADFDFGLTYPATVPPGAMLTMPGHEFSQLSSVPARAGGSVDLTLLPKAQPVEDVVQLCGVRAPVCVDFLDTGARLTIDWDTSILPSCLIWIGDRALQDAPWNGRFRGLGIEPVAAAFDFAEDVSLADNPIARRGIRTAVDISPGAPCVIRYRIEASLIQP
ncbi:hypothetical protein [Mesorhizobium sp. LSHC414A00]|uniref:hypothetical protein n=1 Tax=Mesorhizobium sp. LSHC414A00 TaxID=1287287 RepID=UPI0003CE5E56|nr:hypothetical protein [Mesorhizobium sp. LSHC414A00]ESX79406.1 hypothetical protein X757_03165 [Mesorhizobium sp. LSHC414A00]